MSRYYIGSDYAGIEGDNNFYYGYERTLYDEWCFVANIGQEEIVIPFSKLNANDKFNCEECLIAGMTKIFETFDLERRH